MDEKDEASAEIEIPIRYLVFDANVFGRDALPNIRLIERYAEACRRRDVALLIPESVVWELAEHAMAQSDEVLDIIERHNRKREEWGVSRIELPDAFSLDDIRRQVEGVGAKTIELSGGDAKEALKDQVLQVGAGTKKGKTKTGGSDSAAFRSVATEYGNVIENVLIVTADIDAATSTFDRLGMTRPRIAKHLGEIGALFDETVAAGSEISAQFYDAVKRLAMGEGIFDEAALLEVAADLQRSMLTLPGGAGLENRGWEVDEDGTNVIPMEVLPTDEPVIRDDWTKTVKSKVAVEGWLLQDLFRQDFIGSEAEFATFQVRTVVELEVELGFDGDVKDVLWDVSYVSSTFDPEGSEVIDH
jgi:hypothetical protein